MDFRVDATLWAQPSTGRSATGKEPGEDFMGHLRQDHKRPQSQRENSSEGNDTPLAEHSSGNERHIRAADQKQLQATDGRSPKEMTELYPLGLMAGTHLSHIGDRLARSQGQAKYSEAYVAQRAVDPSEVLQRHLGSGTSASLSSSSMPATSSVRSENASRPTEAMTQAAGFSARLLKIWPERHFLLLPRNTGVEMLIRDYHLTPEDLDLLVSELNSSDAGAEQLWVNGKRVWQRANPSWVQGESGNGY